MTTIKSIYCFFFSLLLAPLAVKQLSASGPETISYHIATENIKNEQSGLFQSEYNIDYSKDQEQSLEIDSVQQLKKIFFNKLKITDHDHQLKNSLSFFWRELLAPGVGSKKCYTPLDQKKIQEIKNHKEKVIHIDVLLTQSDQKKNLKEKIHGMTKSLEDEEEPFGPHVTNPSLLSSFFQLSKGKQIAIAALITALFLAVIYALYALFSKPKKNPKKERKKSKKKNPEKKIGYQREMKATKK